MIHGGREGGSQLGRTGERHSPGRRHFQEEQGGRLDKPEDGYKSNEGEGG